MRALALTLALSLAAAGSASARGTDASLTFQNPQGAPVNFLFDGAAWSCQSGACTASGGADQAAPRACRRIVAQYGPVSAFTWQGKTLTSEQLAACNAAAKKS
jgi:hypothetical protein